MTAPEYIQLRAFARVDGLRLALLWLASFACYVGGLRQPILGLAAMTLAMVTPFLSYRLLRHYRQEALGDVISMRRAWLYVVFQFFYAGLLFAICQFAYFSWIDKGTFVSQLSQLMNDPQSLEALRQMGMGEAAGESLQLLAQMRPIDLVLNILTSNLLVGCLMGLPISLVARRARPAGQ